MEKKLQKIREHCILQIRLLEIIGGKKYSGLQTVREKKYSRLQTILLTLHTADNTTAKYQRKGV